MGYIIPYSAMSAGIVIRLRTVVTVKMPEA